MAEVTAAPAIDFRLAERLDALSRQVISLSADMSTLGSKQEESTKTLISISRDLIQISSENTRSLAALWDKMNTQDPPRDTTRTSRDREPEQDGVSTPCIGSAKPAGQENETESRMTTKATNETSDKARYVVKQVDGEETEEEEEEGEEKEEDSKLSGKNDSNESNNNKTNENKNKTVPNSAPGKKSIDRRLYVAVIKLSKDHTAVSSLLTSLVDRVTALEQYASPSTGALVNASRLIGGKFQKLDTRMRQAAMQQARSHTAIARALSSVKDKVQELGETLGHKQNQLVVDVSTAFLTSAFLSTTVRIHFTKNFSRVPEVCVSLSGFAMDPDQPGSDVAVTEQLSQSRNFYAALLQNVTDIDVSGFSVFVNDGRQYGYGTFQWMQFEYIAIGE
ncbi:hypothetical protein EGW08_020546 [Elysia chlorotica]|uniref:Uncharacterized protein n=1 Tax=Elysia chlorotica TaxID=188477 RepID=A0A433SR10_ELYCH|nr:hypothetical protein EGW08_020546 [Elysia chlorotica]